jgi:transposase
MYLNSKRIKYYIRIPENFYADNPKNNKHSTVWWLFADLKCGQCKFLISVYYVNGQLCYLSGSRIQHKGKMELQIIISFNRLEHAQETYKDRRQIETAFRALKSSGFNIEDTHLTDIDRIKKLFSPVMIAFAWAYVVGVFANENLKKIEIKKHGKRAKSIFKYGLQFIANVLLNPLKITNINVFDKFLSCT